MVFWGSQGNKEKMSMQGGEIATDRKSLEDLPIGSHCAFAYQYSSEKQSRIFPFVHEMIQRGSCYLFYIAGKQGVKGIRLSMKDSGIDVAAFERAKRLKIVDSEEWYLSSGKVPSFKPINEISLQFSRFQDEALSSSGVGCVVIISEIDMLTRKGFFPSYQEFDKVLGRNIPKTIFVCTCDLQELKAAGISVDSLAAVHDTMAK